MLGIAFRAARAATSRVARAVTNDVSLYVLQKLGRVEPGTVWRYRFTDVDSPALRVAEHGLCKAAAQACSTAGYHAAGLEQLLSAARLPVAGRAAEGEKIRHRLAVVGSYAAGLVALGFGAAQQAFADRAEETRERSPDEALQEEFGGSKAEGYDALGIFGFSHEPVMTNRGGIFG